MTGTARNLMHVIQANEWHYRQTGDPAAAFLALRWRRIARAAGVLDEIERFRTVQAAARARLRDGGQP